ncbi:hypothetical protein [Sulfurimonas sp.]|uniref:hypothetical protein n=1 Tax=Sulfurimonas sp. TaxID=2022749 RepID=UPI0025CE40C0|nr:hypothetical protein [Sulfurimonas sp.]MBW6487572.1 hypothetical protein [Sulfurimonas sp.]
MKNKNISREELLKKSLIIKTYKYESTLFVNILSAIKPYAFSCAIDDLDVYLKTLGNYPIATKLTIDKKEIDVFLIRHLHVDNRNKCKIILHDGTIITGNALDYNAISPSLQEFKKMILESIKEF